MVPLPFRNFADAVNEMEPADKVGKRIGPRQLFFIDNLPLRGFGGMLVNFLGR